MASSQQKALELALEAMNKAQFDYDWYAAKEAIKDALVELQYKTPALSRRQINDLWMQSSDIYDFARRVQCAARDNKAVPALREHVSDPAEDIELQALHGLQP